MADQVEFRYPGSGVPALARTDVQVKSAEALAAAPAALILDEPTFGQDRRTAIELLDLLAALRDQGRAIVFATHDREFAGVLADRTLRLSRATGSAP
jgi:energy-coupling factor transport system ATP-binding protein